MKKEKFSEIFIQEHLLRHFKNSKFRFINTMLYPTSEIADFLAVSTSSYVHEIEIKITVADFNKDFDKPKHDLIKFQKLSFDKKVANRFSFCVPEDMISVLEVPRYAGLIYITKNGNIKVIKKAPLIHKTKYNIEKRLFKKMYYVYEGLIIKNIEKRLLAKYSF